MSMIMMMMGARRTREHALQRGAPGATVEPAGTHTRTHTHTGRQSRTLTQAMCGVQVVEVKAPATARCTPHSRGRTRRCSVQLRVQRAVVRRNSPEGDGVSGGLSLRLDEDVVQVLTARDAQVPAVHVGQQGACMQERLSARDGKCRRQPRTGAAGAPRRTPRGTHHSSRAGC